MKYTFILCVTFTFILITTFSNAQVLSNGLVTNSLSGSNVFLDASQFSSATGTPANVGKGLIVPSVNLVNFAFDLTLVDSSTFSTLFDGMIVYNDTAGTTLTAGNRSSTATLVTPGFYYFSNPNGAASGNVTGGVWRHIGGSFGNVKSKTVVVTVAPNPTNATLALGTSVIAANEVNTFLGAKVYDSAGNLVMTADSAYNKVTNLLSTANGLIHQVLAAGTYSVVVEYR